MSPPAAQIVLVCQDPACAAVIRRLVASTSLRLSVVDLGGALAIADGAQPAAILVDIDSIAAPETAISVLALRTTAPVIALVTPRPRESILALARAGAGAVLAKTGGASGLGLLRREGGVLREHLRGLEYAHTLNA